MSDFGHPRAPGSPVPSPQGLVAARCARAEWMSDEVAIDFPSLHAVVERIRAGFHDEDPNASAVATDIVMTRSEARRGVTRTLRVPMHALCSRCGGRGEVWAESCEPCGGQGALSVPRALHVAVPAGVDHGERLRVMAGTAAHPRVCVELRVIIV